MNRRFYLHLRDNRKFLLKEEGKTWRKHFSTLLQSIHYVISRDPETSTRLTVFDSVGRKIVDTFV